MEYRPTRAMCPDRILLYLLKQNELPTDIKIIVYQKDLNLAINALRDNSDELCTAMKQLTTLFSVVTIFPSKSNIPTKEEVEQLREEVL